MPFRLVRRTAMDRVNDLVSAISVRLMIDMDVRCGMQSTSVPVYGMLEYFMMGVVDENVWMLLSTYGVGMGDEG